MRVELILTAALAVAGLALMPTPVCRGGERSASASLKTLTSAQADFRANDRDGNGVNDYWTRDVAGLYAFSGRDGMIKLIELSVAGADSAPGMPIDHVTTRSPKAGYWFKAIRPAAGPDPTSRFAYCAYPAAPNPKVNWIYIVDERSTVYRGRLDRVGIPDTFPSDANLEHHWAKMD